MNALVWKKYKSITKNRKNIVRFFLVPVVIMLGLFFFGKTAEASVFYFQIITILLGFFTDQMDLENIIHKEYAMYTPLTLKKSWIINSTIIWLSNFLYTFALMFLGYLAHWCVFGKLYIPFLFLLKGAINGLFGLGFILFGSQYEIDHAKWKQYLCFIWMPAALLLMFLLDEKSKILPIGFDICVYLGLCSLILAILALIINKRVNTEKYIISLENIRRMVSAKFNLID